MTGTNPLQVHSDDELNAYPTQLKPDGSLPPNAIPALLELMTTRTERLSVEDIRAVGGLAGGSCNAGEKVGSDQTDQAMRAIVSTLAK